MQAAIQTAVEAGIPVHSTVSVTDLWVLRARQAALGQEQIGSSLLTEWEAIYPRRVLMSGQAREPGLLPLGPLAPAPGGQAWSGSEIDLSLTLADDVRERVTAYLAGCPVFLAWMEHTRDVIGDRFGVAGGSAIASDGVYYWRVDAAEYVREYGVAVPTDALAHFEEVSWRPPKFVRDEYLAIYEKLDSILGGGELVE